MKNKIITDYIASFDFTNENWSINEIKASLQRLLGETPAIKVNYVKDVKINEIKGSVEEIKKIDSISVIYTDTDDKLKKSDFRLDI